MDTAQDNDQRAPARDAGSPLDDAAHVAALLHATAKRLRLVFDEARPKLTSPSNAHITAPGPLSIPIIRAALCAAAADLAQVVNGARPDQWTRTAEQEQQTICAEALLHDALTQVAHRLERSVGESGWREGTVPA